MSCLVVAAALWASADVSSTWTSFAAAPAADDLTQAPIIDFFYAGPPKPPPLPPQLFSLSPGPSAMAEAEAEPAEATSSRRRRLCAAADCTEVAYMGALFEAMRVDIINTGDAKVVDLIAAFRTSAWSKCSLGSAPARLVCLLGARLAALDSSALPGRGRSTGRPATASGARASRL
eukprot:scaffold6783_cov61-Phaeocystis_antarctica.AAC.2